MIEKCNFLVVSRQQKRQNNRSKSNVPLRILIHRLMMLFAFELLVSNIQSSILWNRLCLHFIDNSIQTRTFWRRTRMFGSTRLSASGKNTMCDELMMMNGAIKFAGLLLLSVIITKLRSVEVPCDYLFETFTENFQTITILQIK